MDQLSIHNLPTVALLVALVSGGAMGAIINTIVSRIRDKVQPVAISIETDTILRPKAGESTLQARVVIPFGAEERTFANLFVALVKISNRGNRDIPEFRFGLTLGKGDAAIYIEANGDDRHHEIRTETEISPNSPSEILDFTCKPFNRGDTYSISIFIVVNDEKAAPEPIQPSSAHSIRFVAQGTRIDASQVLDALFKIASKSYMVGTIDSTIFDINRKALSFKKRG